MAIFLFHGKLKKDQVWGVGGGGGCIAAFISYKPRNYTTQEQNTGVFL